MNNTNKTTEDKPRTDTLKEPILEKKILISVKDPKYSNNRMALVGYTVREEDVVNKMPRKINSEKDNEYENKEPSDNFVIMAAIFIFLGLIFFGLSATHKFVKTIENRGIQQYKETETKQQKETSKMSGPDNPEVKELKQEIAKYENLLKSAKKAYWNNPPAPGFGEVSLCQPENGSNWPDDSRLLIINVSNTDWDF